MPALTESRAARSTLDTFADIYLAMWRIRFFEEKVAWFFSRGLIHGTTHLYVGEEAVAAGVCSVLREEDLITSTHRGHGHCIARGIDLNRMMAELLGKEAGYCKGKGGSMHIADLSRGNLGANGVVGGGISIAVGAGLTTRMKGLRRVVACFFGDGAANEGIFHESLNLAAIWDLPVIFVCENNQYGMSMSVKRSMKISDISVRASSYGMPGKTVDGNDVFAVRQAAAWAREHALAHGPVLLVCETYRHKGHSKSDANRYRTKEEIEDWKSRDPIPRMRAGLIGEYGMTAESVDALEQRASKEIEDAVKFAEGCPAPSISTIADDVYA